MAYQGISDKPQETWDSNTSVLNLIYQGPDLSPTKESINELLELDPIKPVYTDTDQQLTSDPIVTGVIGYLTRTGTSLSLVNVDDDFEVKNLTVHDLSIKKDIYYDYQQQTRK